MAPKASDLHQPIVGRLRLVAAVQLVEHEAREQLEGAVHRSLRLVVTGAQVDRVVGIAAAAAATAAAAAAAAATATDAAVVVGRCRGQAERGSYGVLQLLLLTRQLLLPLPHAANEHQVDGERHNLRKSLLLLTSTKPTSTPHLRNS